MAEQGPLPVSHAQANKSQATSGNTQSRRHRRSTVSRRRADSKHININVPLTRPSPSSGVYLGSYSRSAYSRASSLPRINSDTAIDSSRTSVSHVQLDPLLSDVDETGTFSLHDFRDGFFDAAFARPKSAQTDGVSYSEQATVDILSWSSAVEAWKDAASDLLDDLYDVYQSICFTRTGVKLVKAFTGFFLAYIVCLVPSSRVWLGEYFYILPVSCIINHPARSVGSQIDGALLTCLGVATGLLWGGLAIYTATSTVAAIRGSGAAIVPFLMLFTLILGWLRCVFNRFFQAIICAGIALFYMCLADSLLSTEGLDRSIWHRFSQFMVPFALGQALCLLINVIVLPSAGNRPLAYSFSDSLIDVRSTLVLPRAPSLDRNRALASHFVEISQTVRDFTIDLTFSKFSPDDARALRNLIQGVLRSMIALQPSTNMFDLCQATRSSESTPAALVAMTMAGPTRSLIDTLDRSVGHANSAILYISSLGTELDGQAAELSSMTAMIDLLRQSCKMFDESEQSLSAKHVGISFSSHSDIVDLFLFMHPIRLAANKIILLLEQLVAMLERKPRWQLHLPSYPWSKAFYRMNPTVRHDRGGLTAAFYFQSKRQLDRTMKELQSRDWKPLRKDQANQEPSKLKRSWTIAGKDKELSYHKDEDHRAFSRIRHSIWSSIHRLQNFESRFAIKVTLVCTLLSTPGFLPQSAPWWYENDCWWVIVTLWIMMHPRTGGNLADLFIRTSCAALGALWAGISYAAGTGNPYVMAAFSAIFMLPMIYRFTQSNHPRSGIIGCLSFTVVSLVLISPTKSNATIHVAWTRGLVFVVGCIIAILVNWVLWPFVARHELRKSLSSMLLNCAIIYRSVIARYIYYADGHEPGEQDVERSEVLESTLREGFVRIRQLMDLTKHEIRLRAPFDQSPYGALIDACEEFFDRLVDVRQSSLFFKPEQPSAADNIKHNLLALRRDAVAAILMNLYVLAGALRSHRPLPKYLPSAAQARRRLLDAMELVEAEKEEAGKVAFHDAHNWEDVYKFAYSSALTDIVGQVQELEKRTRDIVGVVGSRITPNH